MRRHVKLDGNWYRLAEDAEGTHYSLSSEPLRPPNSTVVQGETSDTFQLRPDLLLWTWTDWSHGEGQLKWNPAEPGRAYTLQGVDPFTRPGELTLGYDESFAQAQAGGDFASVGVAITPALGTLWAVSLGTNAAYEWDNANEYFKNVTTPSITTNGVYWDAICGDSNYLFFHGNSPNYSLVRFDGTTWTFHNDQFDDTLESSMDIKGDYVYVFQPGNGKCYELSASVANTATPETEIYAFPAGDNRAIGRSITAGDKKLYAFTTHGNDTVLHEITPSTASGTGYGRELSFLEGMIAEGIWWQAGLLYLLVRDTVGDWQDADNLKVKRFIIYLDIEGSYGTLGGVRNFDTINGRPSPNYYTSVKWGTYGTGGRLGRTAFSLPPTTEAESADGVAQGLFEIDSVTGGYAAVARAPVDVAASEHHRGLAYFDGKYFEWESNQDHVIIYDSSAYTDQQGIAVSPIFDFGLADEKILESIEISCDALTSDSQSITIGYSLDGADWVDHELAGDSGDTGGTQIVSAVGSTKTFRNMQIRAKLDSDGSGASPVLKSVDVFARVNKHLRVWDLLVDASDDAAPAGWNGAKVMENLLGIEDNTVISFIDRYRSHNKNTAGDAYDAVVDSSQYAISQDGEGIVAMRLIELGPGTGVLPTYVGAGAADDSASGAINPTIHADTAVGDAMILAIETTPGSDDPGTITGWTFLDTVESSAFGFADETRVWVYYKVFEAGDGAPTVPDLGNHQLAQVWSFRGVDTVTFPNAYDTGLSATNDTTVDGFTSAVATVGNCLVVGILGQGDSAAPTSAWSNTNLSLVTKRTEEESLAGDDGTLTMVTGALASAGSTGSFTATTGDTSLEASFTIVLAPKPVT